MTNKSLSSLLAKYIPKNISILDKFKIIYRPYITPFVEVLNEIPGNSKVFDIGCGNGALLHLIYALKNPQKIGGVEISNKLVDNANELLKKSIQNPVEFLEKVDIIQYDGMHLENLKEYDFVLLVDVLHHIPKSQLNKFFFTLKEKMKPGATLILKDIDASKSFLVLFYKLHDFIVSQEIGNEISLSKAQKNLKQTGFNIKSSSYKRMLWYPHYTILATA